MTNWNPPPEEPNPFGQQPYGQQPYGPGYGPYGQPPYPPPQPQWTGTNGLCIAGFILAFFCSLVGLVLSIVGLNQARSRNQPGQGLAIAGIVISILGMVLGVVYFVAVRKTVA